MQQRDFLVEADDKTAAGDNDTLDQIIQRLPATATIMVSDIAAAVPIDPSTVYGWLESGALHYLNLGAKEAPYYKIGRTEFLRFLKSRFN
jgi:hypothetical protein